MSQRSVWTVIAIVILLAILTVSYRITSERGTTETTAMPPPPSSEQTGSTTTGSAMPSTGTTTDQKPVEGMQQPATGN